MVFLVILLLTLGALTHAGAISLVTAAIALAVLGIGLPFLWFAALFVFAAWMTAR